MSELKYIENEIAELIIENKRLKEETFFAPLPEIKQGATKSSVNIKHQVMRF